jgi:4-amino-4-deoxy-L-arabinose transferase-like glycosyltransferase
MNQVFIDARGSSVARPMTADSSRLFRRAVPVLIGLLLLARLIGMAVVPLMDTTEARYGETGRIMAELNDWITPWFDYGVPFWGKPPLAFWVTAASFKAFGVSEFTARLPHLAISVFIVGLAAWLAARRDRDAALPTVALMTGSFLYFISAAVVMIDIELILGTTLAMAGFWLALEAPDSLSTGGVAIHSRAIAGSLFFGGIILGLLAKGPIALVMAGIPTLCWTAYNRRWLDVWRRLPWLAGIALTLLLALPWYGIAEHRTPGFLEYFLVGEHWHRYLTPGWTGDRYGNPHYFPIGTIWGFAVVDTLPWSLLLPFAAWGWRKEIKASAQAIMGKAANGVAAGPGLAANKADGAVGAAGFIGSDVRVWQGYLLIWALTPLLFFTLARNIMLPYVLPGLPAAAILAGGWLARRRRQGFQTDRWLASGLLITLVVMCGLALQNLSQPDKMEYKSVKAMLAVYDHARAQRMRVPAANSPGSELTLSDAPLFFIWARPFSAQFYSRGQAIKVATEDEVLRRIGAGAAHVATPSGDALIASVAKQGRTGEAPSTASAANGVSAPLRRVARIGRYGDFDLMFAAAR